MYLYFVKNIIAYLSNYRQKWYVVKRFFAFIIKYSYSYNYH